MFFILKKIRNLRNKQVVQSIYLKKQLKDALADISRKDNELNLLKKNLKYTKINELDAEIKAQTEELFRLRSMLQQALKIHSNE